MCFSLGSKKTATKASKNILVFKALRNRYGRWESPYQDTTYTFGRTNTSRLIKERDSISVGLHAYKTLEDAKSAGHSKGNIFRAIIPKGASYYTNTTQRVSNELIVLGKMALLSKYIKPVVKKKAKPVKKALVKKVLKKKK